MIQYKVFTNRILENIAINKRNFELSNEKDKKEIAPSLNLHVVRRFFGNEKALDYIKWAEDNEIFEFNRNSAGKKTGWNPLCGQSTPIFIKVNLDYFKDINYDKETLTYKEKKWLNNFESGEFINRVKKYFKGDKKIDNYLNLLVKHIEVDEKVIAEVKDDLLKELVVETDTKKIKKINSSLNNINSFTKIINNNKNFNVTRDIYARRLHTPFTRVNKKIRHTIKINGNETGELDIKSCQPWIMANLDKVSKFSKFLINYTPINDILENHCLYANKDIKQYDSLRGNFEYYKAIVNKGKLWEYLVERIKEDAQYLHFLNLKNIYSDEDIKKHVKKCNNQYFFGDHDTFIFDDKINDYYLFIKKEFPALDIVLKHYKTFNNLPEKSRYKLVSKFLQNIESSIMIDKIYKKIVKDNEFMCITVHDAVILETKNFNNYIKIFNKFFESHDINPPILSKIIY